MSSDLWVAGEDVRKLVEHYIANYHPKLASVDKEIVVLFREKSTKRGGQSVLGTARKAPAILDVLGKEPCRFILEIAADEWGILGESQKGALVDHLLCACRVEEDEETAELKCSIASPEVSFFWEELKRHGDWRPRPQQQDGSSMDVEEVLKGSAPSSEDE